MQTIVNDTTLSERELDALKEAGNIAAAHAATALSKLISEKIMIDVTECNLTKVDKFKGLFGKTEDSAIVINMDIPNRDLCSIMMFFPFHSAIELCDMFYKRASGTTNELSTKEIGALAEIGNICICAYLNALSKLLNIMYMPAPPEVASDSINSVLEKAASESSLVNDYAILIETNFLHNSHANKGHFLFILDDESKNAIFNVFKIQV